MPAKFRIELDRLEVESAVVKRELDNRLRQWEEYEHRFERLLSWLNESEGSLKEFSPKSTLEEKEQQLNKYQVRQILKTICCVELPSPTLITLE